MLGLARDALRPIGVGHLDFHTVLSVSVSNFSARSGAGSFYCLLWCSVRCVDVGVRVRGVRHLDFIIVFHDILVLLWLVCQFAFFWGGKSV